MKLGLGTVQFGTDYGISNPGGITSPSEVAAILAYAAAAGITLIDTALLYEQSELVLGRCLPFQHAFEIVTKTRHFSGQSSEFVSDTVCEDFYLSLERLNQASVYGLLAHNADDLLGPNGDLLFEKMTELKQLKLVKKIGASVYDSVQIRSLLKRFSIDLVQLPVSVFDQRMIVDGSLEELKENGVEVHGRSVFLQGLLLMKPETLHPFFSPLRSSLERFQGFASSNGLTLAQAALEFVLSLKSVDFVICGVNNLQQFKELCEPRNCNMNPEDFSSFSIQNPMFLNPSRWKL